MRVRLPLLLLFACLTGPSRPAASGGLPDWAELASREAPASVFPKARTVQLLSLVETTVDTENRRAVLLREVFHVREGTGDGVGDLAAHASADVRVKSMSIWRKDASGRVERFDKPVMTQQGGELYTDDKTLVLSIPGIAAGAIVAREIAWRMERTDYWVDDMPAHWSFPVLRWDYRLRLPDGWEAQAGWSDYDSGTLRPEPATSIENGFRIWTRGAIDVPVEEEPFAPSDSRLAPVFVVRYGPGGNLPMASWKAVAEWYTEYSRTGLEGREALHDEVAKRIEGAGSREERIRRIADFVQSSVGYVQIYLGDGGIRPHRPAEVFRNRFGDCKDMAHLAVSMLDLAGVRAYPVLARTWSRNRLWADFPSQKFDHCIVAIAPEDPAGSYTFFDPTVKDTPLGRLHSGLEGCAALVIGSEECDLIRLPERGSAESGHRILGRIEYDLALRAVAEIEDIRLGHEALRARAFLRAATAQERKVWMQEGIDDSFVGAEILNLEFPDLDRISDTLRIRLSVRIPRAGHLAGDLALLQPDFMTARAALLFPEKERHRPIAFEAPYRNETRLEIHFPSDWSPESVPTAASVTNEIALYDRRYETGAGALTLTRIDEVRQKDIPASRYALLQEWDRATVEGDRQRLALRTR